MIGNLLDDPETSTSTSINKKHPHTKPWWEYPIFSVFFLCFSSWVLLENQWLFLSFFLGFSSFFQSEIYRGRERERDVEYLYSLRAIERAEKANERRRTKPMGSSIYWWVGGPELFCSYQDTSNFFFFFSFFTLLFSKYKIKVCFTNFFILFVFFSAF